MSSPRPLPGQPPRTERGGVELRGSYPSPTWTDSIRSEAACWVFNPVRRSWACTCVRACMRLPDAYVTGVVVMQRADARLRRGAFPQRRTSQSLASVRLQEGNVQTSARSRALVVVRPGLADRVTSRPPRTPTQTLELTSVSMAISRRC